MNEIKLSIRSERRKSDFCRSIFSLRSKNVIFIVQICLFFEISLLSSTLGDISKVTEKQMRFLASKNFINCYRFGRIV